MKYKLLQYTSYLRIETEAYNNPTEDSAVLTALRKLNMNDVDAFKDASNTVDKHGNTPLHLAIINNNLKSQLEIVNYLLEQEEVDVNAKNLAGQTPIYNAARTGKLQIVESLLGHGAAVNVQDSMGYAPLHFAVCHPRIAHLLIENGANVDARNFDLCTPLHYAVYDRNMETVCMLLYYNCDPSLANSHKNTPFMEALTYRYEEIQHVLFEYIDDINDRNSNSDSLLTMALLSQSPYIEEILSRGAEVGCKDIEPALLQKFELFEIIWKKLPNSELKRVKLLDNLLNNAWQHRILKYIDIILKNSDDVVLAIIADKFHLHQSFNYFFEVCYGEGNLEALTQFVCILLQYNCMFFDSVVYDIYLYCGYCDLFKYFLYINQIKYTDYYDIKWIVPMYILNIKSDFKSISEDPNCYWYLPRCRTRFVLKLLEFTVNKSLINQIRYYYWGNENILKICDKANRLPSLLELARNQTRKYIVSRFNFSTSSQYYTFIDNMDINNVYKAILRWEKPLYSYNTFEPSKKCLRYRVK